MPEHFHIPDRFSPEEIQNIREALSVLGERPMCPLCDRDLEVECVVATIMSVSWHVRCRPCHRAADIAEVRSHGTAANS